MSSFAAKFGGAAVTVGTTATKIVDPRFGRTGLVIYNDGGADLTVGPDSNVTTSSGLPVPAKQSVSLDYFTGTVYGICASGTLDVRYSETYSL